MFEAVKDDNQGVGRMLERLPLRATICYNFALVNKASKKPIQRFPLGEQIIRENVMF